MRFLRALVAAACIFGRAGGARGLPSTPGICAQATRLRRVDSEREARLSGCPWLGSRGGQRCGRLAPVLHTVSKLRGGASEEDDLDVDEVAEEQFAEDSYVKRLVASWQKTPLMTKHFIQATVALTLFFKLFGANEWPEILLLKWRPTLFRLQLWRPFTTFLYFGPLSVSYCLTVHFLWTYMSELERRHYKAPEEFFLMCAFGAAGLLLVSALVPLLDPRLLGHSLSCYFVYLWSRLYEGAEANIMGIFNLRVELLPWFFVAQTLLMEGAPPILDLVGIFVGFVYQYLQMKKLMKAPRVLKDFFRTPAIRQDYQRKFAAEFGQIPDEGAEEEDEAPVADVTDDFDADGTDDMML